MIAIDRTERQEKERKIILYYRKNTRSVRDSHSTSYVVKHFPRIKNYQVYIVLVICSVWLIFFVTQILCNYTIGLLRRGKQARI